MLIIQIQRAKNDRFYKTSLSNTDLSKMNRNSLISFKEQFENPNNFSTVSFQNNQMFDGN